MAKQQTFRCGIYLRVSTEEQKQVKEGSIKNQRQRLVRYIEDKNRSAHERKNSETWTLIKDYEEEPRSAKDTKRPKYQEMLRDIRDGVINTILFTEISRASRSVKNFLELGELLEKYDSHFICLQHPELNTATPYGRILLVMLVAMMELEREINADRSARSYQERAKRGLWTGGQILGYDIDPKKKGHLIINTEEEKIVKFIFQQMKDLESPYEVTKRCNERGYRTKAYKSRRGKPHLGQKFSYTSVRQMLSNLAYVAKKQISKQVQGDEQDKKTTETEVIDTACWKPIIKQSVFDEIQRLLRQHAKQRGSRKKARSYQFQLTQLLACRHCKAVLTNGATQKADAYIPYYIHRKGERRPDCPLPGNISAERLDSVVWNRLAKEVNIERELRAALAQKETESPNAVGQIKDDIEETRRAITENKTAHATTLEAFQKSGLQPDPLTVKRLQELSSNVESLEQQLASKQQRLAELRASSSVESQVAAMLKNKKQAFRDLPTDQKIRIAQVLIKGIILNPDSIILDRRVGGEIVGVVQKHAEVRSHPYRAMDVQWLS